MPTEMQPISNGEDIIDSRDIIARIEELELFHGDGCTAECTCTSDAVNNECEHEGCPDEDEHQELDALKALADEAQGYSSDWSYGAALIRDSYFEEFAEDEAENIGAINPQAAPWPLNHIDWEAAANELKHDYCRVDFDGVDYWIRAT